MAWTEAARAKVNLTLHVTGRTAQGYHLLDSLVVFPDLADTLKARVSDRLTLAVEGPFAGALAGEADNLILRAASLLQTDGAGAALTLTKNLPVAAGIGGGSADAAAALRLLARMWASIIPPEAALSLGADVPACLISRSLRMQGIGERITRVKTLPPFWLVLVNSGEAVPTGPVFAGLEQTDGTPMSMPTEFADVGAFSAWLRAQRNDLEPPACAIAPSIPMALSAIRAQTDCLCTRMSGSGATCFGVFADEASARKAADKIVRAQPGWWVKAASVAAG